jgi:hypothetical protein
MTTTTTTTTTDQTMIARLLMSLSLLTLTATGCVKAPIEGRLDPHESKQIHFASTDLKDRTAVGIPTAQRDEEGGILYITVPVRAAHWQELHVDYRVTFFDRNGQVLNQTGWFTRTLTPNVPDRITVNSMGPRAADFQMDFRWAH